MGGVEKVGNTGVPARSQGRAQGSQRPGPPPPPPHSRRLRAGTVRPRGSARMDHSLGSACDVLPQLRSEVTLLGVLTGPVSLGPTYLEAGVGQQALPAERATCNDHSSLGPKHTCHMGHPGDCPAPSAGFSTGAAPGGLASCA